MPSTLAQPLTLRSADLLELGKIRISLMVIISAAAGFLLAGQTAEGSREVPWLLLALTLLGTGLLSSGASTLNQVWERDADARMRRTANRPVPSGRVSPDVALALGVGLVVSGLAVLLAGVNALTACLGALTVAGYVFVYTPLKRISSLATVVGAVPGAVPPLMGWAALCNDLDLGAWALFLLLFFWQLPHFLAIAWMYREDYARGGFPMLTVGDHHGRRTGQQAVLWALALVPVSLLPVALGLAGLPYFGLALVLGLWYLAASWRFARLRHERAARRLLLVSVGYLPAMFVALLLDRLVA